MDEDLDYNVRGSSILDSDNRSEPDVVNLSIIKKRLQITQEKIKELSSIDSLDRTEKLLTLQQQLELAQYKLDFLKNEELDLTQKVKELDGGR